MSFAQYNRLNVHVAASNRAVIKAAHQRIAVGARFAHKFRDARHTWLRVMLTEHEAARELYRQVTSGRFG